VTRRETDVTPQWRLLVEADGRSGAENMAVDNALLRDAKEGIASLRLYRWAPPCLSFGRNEAACRRYDRDRITARGLATVRRPTGGRAVWHEQEVTYAIAAPCAMFGSLREAYITIHRMLARALQRLGVEVALADRRHARSRTPDVGACFASPVGGELISGTRKLVGSAQIREGAAFLQHGSILLQDGQHMVTQVTVGQPLDPTSTALGTILRRPVTFTEVADAIIAEARTTWSGRWEDRRIEPSVADVARFTSDAWTWRR
jgi:lipoate-protein ligase A